MDFLNLISVENLVEDSTLHDLHKLCLGVTMSSLDDDLATG